MQSFHRLGVVAVALAVVLSAGTAVAFTAGGPAQHSLQTGQAQTGEANGTANLSASEVVQDARQSYDGIQNFNATLVRTSTTSNATGTITTTNTTGKLSVKQPSKLRIEYSEPEERAGDIIVSNGTTTTIYDAGNNTVRTLNTSFGGMQAMNQTGYIDTIERTLTQSNVSYEGTATVAGEETFVLSVTPNATGNVTPANQTFYLSQESYLPVKTVSESSFTFGNETTTTRSTTLLRDLQVNVGLPDSLFEFDAPDDAERLGGFTSGVSTYDSIEEVQQNTNVTVCEPSAVPDGYSFANATVTTINNNTSVSLQYTNGSGDPINDSLSVSISTAQSEQQANASEFGQNVSIDGQSGTYVEAGGGGIVTFTADDLRYTITGPFSQDELISIAESIDCAAGDDEADDEDGASDDGAARGDDIGQNDEDDDGDGHVDEDGEDGNDAPSNDDDDGDGAIDEDDEPDDGDDGSDDFGGEAEDDDDGDGHADEDDEEDGGNSDDKDNDGDGAVDEDDEPDTDD
jgi:outer membrane lipoprotein-sorting protein